VKAYAIFGPDGYVPYTLCEGDTTTDFRVLQSRAWHTLAGGMTAEARMTRFGTDESDILVIVDAAKSRGYDSLPAQVVLDDPGGAVALRRVA
jgi:hypothetical protein